MSQELDLLKEIVPAAGSLIGVAAALGVAWMRRANWMPPEETIAGGTLKMVGLTSAVLIGILWLLRSRLGLDMLLVVAFASLLLTITMLCVSVYTNTKYSVYRPGPDPAKATVRVLRGSALTHEAAAIAKKHKLSHQSLFKNAGYQLHLVWTDESIARVQMISVLGFILFQVTGSVALASVTIAFGAQ